MHKCLLITGGSRGIGEKTAALFLKQGWQVINFSRTPCQTKGVINMQVDLANFALSAAQSAELKQLLAQSEQICIVHNAAVYHDDNIKSLTAESLTKVLDINLTVAITVNNLC